ncbi:MAG: M16 family metallopeptidase [Minwuia sp.]|uniref:M16 family metallopeptidase n=1 Tax=Minwuia sp. TaxID=2493630 RepID=UPI003A8A5450
MRNALFLYAQLLAALAVVLSVAVSGARAETGSGEDIVEVRTDSGIVAWLKQEPSIPMIAVSAMWRGAGAVADPADKAGRANLLAATLDEGAGDMDSQAFQQRLDDHGIRLSFEAGRDSLNMTLQTLTENAGEAFGMAGLALSEPRFDAEALDRMRAQIQSSIARSLQNPNAIAGQAFSALAFGDDRYSQPTDGTPETVAALAAEDLRSHMATTVGRENLIIGVVGDITPEALKPLLETAFGKLPAIGGIPELGEASFNATGVEKYIDYEGPQTVLVFGTPGIVRTDPDFDAARVMNHILGGGGFSSLLTEEIREKRGLTYGVYSYLRPLDRGGAWLGGLSTSNEKAAEALTVLKTTIAEYRDIGPDEEQLAKAKANINGAFPLRFASNSAIAELLVAIQRYDLGRDYMARRPERIDAVTVDDIKRVANRILNLDAMIVVGVGQPKGLRTTPTE